MPKRHLAWRIDGLRTSAAVSSRGRLDVTWGGLFFHHGASCCVCEKQPRFGRFREVHASPISPRTVTPSVLLEAP